MNSLPFVVFWWGEAEQTADYFASKAAGIVPVPKRPYGYYYQRGLGDQVGPFETKQEAFDSLRQLEANEVLEG